MDDEEQNQEKLSVSEGGPKPEETPQEQTVFKATRSNLQLPRRLFHLANGTIIATLYLFYIEHNVAVHIIGVGVCLFYIFEQLRVKYPEYADSFSKVSSYFYRAEEQLKESAMIPYAMGLLLTILSFPKIIAVVAIYTLAFSDPLSAIIGIKYGKHPIAENKSMEGSLAFFFSTLLCTFLPFMFTTSLPLGKNLMFSSILATLLTSFELVPSRIDDNLTIPLVTAVLGWIVASLWNIPLN